MYYWSRINAFHILLHNCTHSMCCCASGWAVSLTIAIGHNWMVSHVASKEQPLSSSLSTLILMYRCPDNCHRKLFWNTLFLFMSLFVHDANLLYPSGVRWTNCNEIILLSLVHWTQTTGKIRSFKCLIKKVKSEYWVFLLLCFCAEVTNNYYIWWTCCFIIVIINALKWRNRSKLCFSFCLEKQSLILARLMIVIRPKPKWIAVILNI